MSSADNANSIDDVSVTPTRELSRSVLIAAFVVAFAVACLVLITLGHYLVQAPRSLYPFSPSVGVTRTTRDLVVDPFVISGPEVFEKAVVGERVNPVPGQDYTFFIWIRPRRIPQQGEFISLLGKFDASIGNRPGYALSLEGAPDGVRPRVYLSAGTEHGRWYSFAAYPMNRKRWYLLAVSLSQNTFISAYVVDPVGDQEPTLLGGHRIQLSSLPYSASDLVAGAFGASRYRGEVGPFGILSGEKLHKSLVMYLGDMKAEPNAIPSSLPQQAVQLWASPTRDLGPQQFDIVRGQPNSKQAPVPRVKRVTQSGLTQKKTQRSREKKGAGVKALSLPGKKKRVT